MVMLTPLEMLNRITTQLQSAVSTLRPNGELPDGELKLDTVFMDSENPTHAVKLGPLRSTGDATQPPPAAPAKLASPAMTTPDPRHPLSFDLDPTKSCWSPFQYHGQSCMIVRLNGTVTQIAGPNIPRVASMHFEGTCAQYTGMERLLLRSGQPNDIDAKLIFYPSVGQPPEEFAGRLCFIDHTGAS